MAGLIERLTVLCFAGTYGLALASDLARFAVRWPGRWYATVGLTALGWVVQTAYLANLGLRAARCRCTTPFESLLVLSWVLAAIDIYLIVRSPKPVRGRDCSCCRSCSAWSVAALGDLARGVDRRARGGVAGHAFWGMATASCSWPGRSARAWRSRRA